MQVLLIILIILSLISSVIAWITDIRCTHSIIEQNEILRKNLHIDNQILMKIIKKSEEKSHE